MARDTKKFLEILNRQNEAIAAREAAKVKAAEEAVDPVREQREQERRDKWGQLRAREKPGNRPHRARSVFGYTNTS